MSEVSAQVLTSLAQSIIQQTQQDAWLSLRSLHAIKEKITQQFSSLPLPLARIPLFENCATQYQLCCQWLHDSEQCRNLNNQNWCQSVLSRYHDFSKI